MSIVCAEKSDTLWEANIGRSAPGAMDVTECCRLCLKDASSAEAARIDLHQDQTVADMVQEVYDIYVSGGLGRVGRGPNSD